MFQNSTDGVILKSPDGTRWRVTIDDSGVLNNLAVKIEKWKNF
jgi:hypothetical protein